MQHINFITNTKPNMQEERHYINSIYYQLELTAKYCKYLGSQLIQRMKIPLSLDEIVTLDTLAQNGEMCQRDLAKLILKDRPSTGRILNFLEEKGYVKRISDKKNNRLIRKVILTENGRKHLSKITLELKEYLQKIHGIISHKKIEEMKKSLKDFREILKKEVEINI